MSLRDDMKIWIPMYLWQTLATPAGHVVTAEEWNNYWNLMMTQGDHSAKAILDVRDLLYTTVLNETDGATPINFTSAKLSATNVGSALTELAINDEDLNSDYIARDLVLSNDYNAKFAAVNVRNTADEQVLVNHKSSGDHDGRYYTETEVTNLLALKANLASPAFTGTVTGISRSMVGLGSVDNTADSAKPISVAQQALFDLKASIAQLNAHKTSADHDGRYAFLANETPFTPTGNYHLVTKLYQEQKIAEAVLSGIADNSITDQKMAVGNKKADIVADAVAAALPLIPPAPFDFDTPVGKAGWAYAVTGTGPVTETYKLAAVTKCSRVTTFDSPSAGKTTVVVTAPTGTVTTQIFNVDGTADPITEV